MQSHSGGCCICSVICSKTYSEPGITIRRKGNLVHHRFRQLARRLPLINTSTGHITPPESSQQDTDHTVSKGWATYCNQSFCGTFHYQIVMFFCLISKGLTIKYMLLLNYLYYTENAPKTLGIFVIL